MLCKFVVGATIQKWEVHILDVDLPENFLPNFIGKARYLGVDLADPIVKVHEQMVLRDIYTEAQKNDVKFLFFIIRDCSPSYSYPEMKALQQEFGIATQELRGSTATRRCGPQTIQNLICKMNHKNGGINYAEQH